MDKLFHPCPFCGCKIITLSYFGDKYQAQCNRCKASLVRHTIAALVAAWNRRVKL